MTAWEADLLGTARTAAEEAVRIVHSAIHTTDSLLFAAPGLPDRLQAVSMYRPPCHTLESCWRCS